MIVPVILDAVGVFGKTVFVQPVFVLRLLRPGGKGRHIFLHLHPYNRQTVPDGLRCSFCWDVDAGYGKRNCQRKEQNCGSVRQQVMETAEKNSSEKCKGQDICPQRQRHAEIGLRTGEDDDKDQRQHTARSHHSQQV